MGPTISPDPRTSAHSTGQQGSVLLMVLAVVIMLTVGVVALLNATLNTTAVADKLETDARSLHRVDGALERAVNQVRDDDTRCVETNPALATSVNFGGYDVRCVRLGPPLDPQDPPPNRTMDFEVYEAGRSTVVGLARVRVQDEVNSERLVGHAIEVCDWLLGRQAVTEPFQGCPA